MNEVTNISDLIGFDAEQRCIDMQRLEWYRLPVMKEICGYTG